MSGQVPEQGAEVVRPRSVSAPASVTFPQIALPEEASLRALAPEVPRTEQPRLRMRQRIARLGGAKTASDAQLEPLLSAMRAHPPMPAARFPFPSLPHRPASPRAVPTLSRHRMAAARTVSCPPRPGAV